MLAAVPKVWRAFHDRDVAAAPCEHRGGGAPGDDCTRDQDAVRHRSILLEATNLQTADMYYVRFAAVKLGVPQ
jgi:hypothetical protein